jgi:hypothetical protein
VRKRGLVKGTCKRKSYVSCTLTVRGMEKVGCGNWFGTYKRPTRYQTTMDRKEIKLDFSYVVSKYKVTITQRASSQTCFSVSKRLKGKEKELSAQELQKSNSR